MKKLRLFLFCFVNNSHTGEEVVYCFYYAGFALTGFAGKNRFAVPCNQCAVKLLVL